MSSNDGYRKSDEFLHKNSNIAEDLSQAAISQLSIPQLQTQQQSFLPQPTPIMWPPPPLLNQQFLPPAPQAQAMHTQPHPFNEHYYNVNPQTFASAAGQPETYSVLPVGHGNFLKVYHRAEAAPPTPSIATDATIIYQQQQFPTHSCQNQQQHQIFNSYELFSSNTLMPEGAVTSAAAIPEIAVSTQLHLPEDNSTEMPSSGSGCGNNTTNMIINKLVHNWSPNLTGGTYAQFGQFKSSVITPNENNSSSHIDPVYLMQQPSVSKDSKSDTNFQDAPTLNPLFSSNVTKQSILPYQNQTTSNVTSITSLNNSKSNAVLESESVDTDDVSISSTNCTLDTTARKTLKHQVKGNISTGIPTSLSSGGSQLDGSKKRIVAEVKPMRMTYSDVLSKFNSQHVTSTQSTTSSKSSGNKTSKQFFTDRKVENKRSADVGGNTSTLRQSPIEELPKASKKSSPIHDNKENISQGISFTKGKRFSNSTNSNNPNHKNLQKANQKYIANDASGVNKKRGAQKRTDADFNSDSSSTGRHNNKNINTSSTSTEKDFNGFYNITAKNNDNYDRPMKSSTSQHSSSSGYRRSAKSTSSSYSNTASTSSQNFSRNVQRSAHPSSSGVSLLSYSFSTAKRGRGGSSSLTNNQGGRNYELAKMFLHKWFKFTLMILNWLFYLVYDIVVLGFSMAYDRLTHYYICGFAYAMQLRKELMQNSNKPSIWIKNFWRRFDAKFKKNSNWAIWRRFYKKKQTEMTTDFYKNGRLPQTGEEAMYSLLNCKGKDAYSILGVPSNSPQEQIRKHYKKIAVLVHPDKNKQAGAEEAFKVLQRAFELVGEPENREAYDRSLDEALHAEKAWTELHDLLSQLQTKITEAANTIRCSTCGLRHPRKLTDRPHYAARECASCKIRHSAREGDIWAEATMLGLRWKYLALMEGKVYDITEWANCQKGALSHLEPNSHMVQYRIVRGAQQQQQQQNQQYQQQSHSNQHSHHSHAQSGGSKYKRDIPPNEASLHEFLDNLYSRQHPNNQPNASAFPGSTRKRNRRN